MRRISIRLVASPYSDASPTRTLFRLWVAYDKVWETLDQQINRQTSRFMSEENQDD